MQQLKEIILKVLLPKPGSGPRGISNSYKSLLDFKLQDEIWTSKEFIKLYTGSIKNKWMIVKELRKVDVPGHSKLIKDLNDSVANEVIWKMERKDGVLDKQMLDDLVNDYESALRIYTILNTDSYWTKAHLKKSMR